MYIYIIYVSVAQQTENWKCIGSTRLPLLNLKR